MSKTEYAFLKGVVVTAAVIVLWFAVVAPNVAHASVTNKQRIASRLDRWMRYYHVPDRRFWVRKGLHIAKRESGYRPSADNGSHHGIFQMTSGWGPHRRLHTIDYACRRFAKCLKQQGPAGIRRHWRATY